MEKRNVKDLIWAIIGFLGIGFFVGAIIYVVVNDNKPAPEPVVVPSGGISDLNYYDLLPDPRQVVTGEGNITVYKPNNWVFRDVEYKYGIKTLDCYNETGQISVFFVWCTDCSNFQERIEQSDASVVKYFGRDNIENETLIDDCQFGRYDGLSKVYKVFGDGKVFYLKLIWVVKDDSFCAIQIYAYDEMDFGCDDLKYIEKTFRMPNDL